ncbi:MAG: TerB family tellurite resistance protein [Burkholderiales bacterium]
MLRTLKRLFDETAGSDAVPGSERRHLQLAVATLLHESTRVDLESHPAEYAAAERALADLCGLGAAECSSLLNEARGKGGQLTSYFAQVAVIKRDFSMAQRVALVEHLWHIAYAHHPLDPYEDHFVRKIAHLLHVPNTQCMLARAKTGG